MDVVKETRPLLRDRDSIKGVSWFRAVVVFEEESD